MFRLRSFDNLHRVGNVATSMDHPNNSLYGQVIGLPWRPAPLPSAPSRALRSIQPSPSVPP